MYDDYNTIENHRWIPKKAFLYLPNGDSKKREHDDFKMIIEKNQLKRLIYEGGIDYLEEEDQRLTEFRKHLENSQIYLDKRWSKAYIYKFLQSTEWDYKRTINQIQTHNKYQAQLKAKDFQQLKRNGEQVLKKGIFYFNGRDSKFRPILVTDIAKIHASKITQKQLYNALQYYFEFMYRNMLINGQVQNVVGIIDVGYTSPLNLISPMKMSIGFLQGNYKYKLHAVYIIRSTGMFQFAYGIAKKFMKEDTIRKINVVKDQHKISALLQYANPTQVEQKFGGSHKNLESGQFWPPRQFGDDYSHPNVKANMITPEQYKARYQEGLLPRRKILLQYVKDEKDCPFQTPILNNNRQSIKFIDDKSSIIQKQRKMSRIERAMQKITCGGCFGHRQQHSSRTSKKKTQQQ